MTATISTRGLTKRHLPRLSSASPPLVRREVEKPGIGSEAAPQGYMTFVCLAGAASGTSATERRGPGPGLTCAIASH